MNLSPRHLILNLLTSSPDGLSAREVVAAAALLGLPSNATRVALTRLTAGGWLSTPRRGEYRVGAAAAALAQDVGAWRARLQQACAWDGRWMLVRASPAWHKSRSATRAMARALALSGLAAYDDGLYIRPANLQGGAAALQVRLARLSGTVAPSVWVAEAGDPAMHEQAKALWDGPGISAEYAAQTQALRQWMARVSKLPQDRAAREAFERGNAAIHAVLFDPLLPDCLVDASRRSTFFATVQEFDALGHQLWRDFLSAVRMGAPRTPASGTSDEPEFSTAEITS